PAGLRTVRIGVDRQLHLVGVAEDRGTHAYAALIDHIGTGVRVAIVAAIALAAEDRRAVVGVIRHIARRLRAGHAVHGGIAVVVGISVLIPGGGHGHVDHGRAAVGAAVAIGVGVGHCLR